MRILLIERVFVRELKLEVEEQTYFCFGATPSTMLRAYSWQCSDDHIGARGIEPKSTTYKAYILPTLLSFFPENKTVPYINFCSQRCTRSSFQGILFFREEYCTHLFLNENNGNYYLCMVQ